MMRRSCISTVSCLGLARGGVGTTSPYFIFLFLTPLASVQFSSVTQSCPTLRPHGLQHTRLPCPSPTPRVYSNSCVLSR